MKRTNGLWFLLLALVSGLPGPVRAQEVVTVQTNRGWIGITVNVQSGLVGGEERTVVVVGNVVKGSPADSAGLQAGDTLTHIDGQPISQRVFSTLGTLEVGDLVPMTVRRDGRDIEVVVEAGPRLPAEWVVRPNSGEMVVHLDSIRGAILKNLDSLRLDITSVGPDSLGGVRISVLPEPRGSSVTSQEHTFYFSVPSPDSLGYVGEFFGPEAMAVPFGAFVVGTEETDSLKVELQRLRRSLTEVRREELSRIRELQAGVQRPVEELARQDQRVQELRAREQQLLNEQALATQELRRRTDEIMRTRMARIQEEQMRTLARIRESQQESRADLEAARQAEERAIREQYEVQRPGSHIILGQNFVAGAQLTALNPTLAEYFQVEEGVLVMEVLKGTPASEAGMKAGDVIVRVGNEDVTSLEDLRFYVGYLDRPLRIRVIRKGSPVDITIPR